MSTNIHKLDKSSVFKICSGQVIKDLSTAVKELVDNSLDAHATRIDIILRCDGLDGFDISDNGDGIEKSCWDMLMRKHCTVC